MLSIVGVYIICMMICTHYYYIYSVVCGRGGGGGSGAEKLIALPVLTLVAVALSVLF